MFCRSCGNELVEGAEFCHKCGANTEIAPLPKEYSDGSTDTAIQSKNKKKIVTILSVIAAFVVITITIFLLFGSGSKRVARKLVKATLTCDAETHVKLYSPKTWDMFNLDDKTEYDKWVKIVSEEMQNNLEKVDDHISQFGEWKVSHKVTDTRKWSQNEIREYEERYNVSGVQKAEDVTVKLTLRFNGEQNSREITIPVFKIDGKWCFDSHFFSYSTVLNQILMIYNEMV